MIKRVGAVIAALLCAVFTGCSKTDDVQTVTGKFEITFLKAGQADAIVLQTEEHTAVIDCGEKDDGDKLVELLAEKGTEKIDYLFITHFDKDHVGGAAKLIENVAVDNIITPNYEGSVKEYDKFIAAADEKGLDITRLTENMQITLDDVSLSIYPPLKSEYDESDNDYSLAITAQHGGNSFLFAGDAESERLKEIVTQLGKNTYTLLKVPHHGRYNDFTDAFISAARPVYAVITCSEKNPAEEKVIKALEGVGSQIFYTADGNIEVISDGVSVSVDTKPAENT